MQPTDDFDMPAPPVVKQVVPEAKAKEMAFYGSTIAGESITPGQRMNARAQQAISDYHESTYDRIHTDLRLHGESEDLNDIHKQVQDNEDEQSRGVLAGIISDPNIDNNTKIAAIKNRPTYTSLRDRYLIKAAVEDHSNNEEDRNSHDELLNYFENSKRKQAELQALISGQTAKLNPTGELSSAVGSFVGAAVRDMVPMVNSATMLSVLKKAGHDTGIFKGLVLSGETIHDIGKEYDAMNDDQKLAFAKPVLAAIAEIPGFDWNKYELIQNIFETPDLHVGWRTFDNLLSIADTLVVGAAATAPVKAARAVGRWFLPSKAMKDFMVLNAVGKQVDTTARIDPTLKTAHPADAPNPPTGTVEVAPPNVYKEAPEQVNALHYLNTPKVAPNSALGVLRHVNPQKAEKASVEALLDDTGKLADSLGTSKGEIIADSLPGWVKNVDDVHPDIAEKLRANDKYFNDVLNENIVDPNFVDIVARNSDKDIIYQAFKEARGGHYQQANSTVVDSLTEVSGSALFGRNSSYGWSKVEDAQQALRDIQESIPALDKVKATVVNRNNQYYVQYDYTKKYDPFTEFAMGSQTVSANIYPIPFSDIAINADRLARSSVGRALFPPTTMYDPWIPKHASGVVMRSSKVESDFLRVIKDDVMSIGPKEELGKELRLVQENAVWKDYKDLAANNAHLNAKELKELYSGYVNYRRLNDYHYEWVNLADHKIRVSKDQEAIYKTDGTHIGYGTRASSAELDTIKYVWDMDTDAPIKLARDAKGELQLNGRTIVRMDGGVNKSADEITDIQDNFQTLSHDNIFRFAIVGGKTELKSLPHRTLNRIEGYVGRTNIENWYVKKIPKVVRLDGDELVTDPDDLKAYHKTIGAEWSKERAEKLAARLQKEDNNKNYTIEVARDRHDSASSIVADYKVFEGMMEHSKKRGDRLPTLDGKARLEDPIEQLANAIRTAVRMGMWSDYQEVFQKNYTTAFRGFLKEGQFPNVVTDIQRPKIESEEDIAKFQAAVSLYKQYANQQYKVTVGDDVWKAVFHGIGDILEKTNIRALSEGARDIADTGNAFVKLPKTLGSVLFLHLNPPRQWLVQTQQNIELVAMSPSHIGNISKIPGIGLAILSRASYFGKHQEGVYKAAQKMSGMDAKEFDAVFNAIYKSGLPQSVDLNMMLHGMYDDMKLSMDKSVGREGVERVVNLIKTPGTLGKMVGYTPAELSNTIGVWMFAKDRWVRNNPGKNWNTPQNIARISGDGWDLAKSMATRAGAMPWGDGFMSLFFQFAQAPFKGLMEMFSSKTLTKNERGKLIAARMSIWGIYGTAFGQALDKLVVSITDPEFQAKWHEYKGALADVVTNKLLMDSFKAAGEKESTLALSASMGPLPSTHPFIQVVEEMSKALDGQPTNPRFAFTGSVGAIYEAATDIHNMFTANEFNTKDAVLTLIREFAEATSGYNNYIKTIMARELQTKIDKVGRDADLELAVTDAFAQAFGVITREEQFGYAMSNARYEDENLVKTRAKELDEAMRKNQLHNNTEDWDKYIESFRKLNALTPKHLQERVRDEFHSLQGRQMKSGKESNFAYILNNIRNSRGQQLNEMVGMLMASKDKESQELLEILRKEGLIEDNK